MENRASVTRKPREVTERGGVTGMSRARRPLHGVLSESSPSDTTRQPQPPGPTSHSLGSDFPMPRSQRKKDNLRPQPMKRLKSDSNRTYVSDADRREGAK